MWSANPVANAESGPETLTRDRSINIKAWAHRLIATTDYD
jgi:hypothetical protein